MSRSVRLRPWQHAALARFQSHPRADFLAVATPGAGKTTFALAALRTSLAARPAKVVVVAPTAHLKLQWSAAAAGLGLHLDPSWAPADGGLPPDMHGIVTTYQQVAASAAALRGQARGAHVVLDEIHHAAEDQAWGASLREAFGASAARLALSGTPFRSDTQAIPFVRYESDEAIPDYEYGYGDALRDGRVVRPVYFPRLGGRMEWSAPDGDLHEATFEDPLALQLANQRLRTALSPEGDWLPTILGEAVDRLAEVRRGQPDAAGLVIAIDQDHARDIAELLRRRFRRGAELVTSDDPTASARISAFRDGRDEWLVAVRMVSEGVDIPRLRVGVYATTTTTDLFFRQAVGRLVRWMPGVRDQRAWLYLPDDPRLRSRAAHIAEQRRHSLRREVREDGDQPTGSPPEARAGGPAGVQLSLFEALAAVPIGEAAAPSPWQEALPDEGSEGDASILVDLAPPPPVAAALAAEFPGLTRRQVKDRLRDQNTEVARDIAYVTGQGHAAVNAELNRMAGLERVTLATVEQLQVRLDHGRRWLARLRVPPPASSPGGPQSHRG